MPTHATNGGNGGVGTAAKTVAEHASALARLEMELASLELKQKVAKLGIGAALLIVGGLFGLYGLGFGLAAVAAAIDNVLPTWLSRLIVMGGLFLLAGLLAIIGLGRIRKGTPPVPEQAIAEAKTTQAAIKSNG
jgi:DMSO reductase anchor subunit